MQDLKVDGNSMKKYLSEIDWDESLVGKDTMEQWSEFPVVITKCVVKFVPKKKLMVKKKRAKWMDKQAHKARRNKYLLWKKYTESKRYSDYVNYCSAFRKATKEVRRPKNNFEK